MPGITYNDELHTGDEAEEGLPDVVMAAVYQNSRLGVAWYDSARGEVRHPKMP